MLLIIMVHYFFLSLSRLIPQVKPHPFDFPINSFAFRTLTAHASRCKATCQKWPEVDLMHVSRSPCLSRARYVAECVTAEMELQNSNNNSNNSLSAGNKTSLLPFFKKNKKNTWVLFLSPLWVASFDQFRSNWSTYTWKYFFSVLYLEYSSVGGLRLPIFPLPIIFSAEWEAGRAGCVIGLG